MPFPFSSHDYDLPSLLLLEDDEEDDEEDDSTEEEEPEEITETPEGEPLAPDGTPTV